MEPADVPHFGLERWDEPGAQSRETDEWLEQRGMATAHIAYSGEDLNAVLASIGALNPRTFYLLGGMSRTGVNHTVIGCGGAIAWDPSLDDAGIIGPCQPDGYYWVTFIVPARMVAA